jgi:DNA-binding NarL/FixJ family response regulator
MMIKVILVDDHPVVRSGVKHTMADQPHIRLLAEADNATEGYKLYTDKKPDVILLDLDLPDSSLAVLGQMVAAHPQANVIVFSAHEDITFAVQAISAGAKGYILKSSEPEELITAIEHVAQGKPYLTPEVAQQIALQKLNFDQNPMRDLTTREFEVFRLLAEGESIESIAEHLKIGQKTVANYQTILKQKLHISSPIQLIRLALKHRVITLNFSLLPMLVLLQE